jgi:hypothetical protein
VPGDRSVRQRQFLGSERCVPGDLSPETFRLEAPLRSTREILSADANRDRYRSISTPPARPNAVRSTRQRQLGPVSPGIELLCELPEFSVRERLWLISLDLRQADTCRGIPGNGPVLHGVVEDSA